MGLFDRLRGRDADSTPDHAAASADDVTADDSGVEALEEIGIRRLTAQDEAALDRARAGYAAHGIEPSDRRYVVPPAAATALVRMGLRFGPITDDVVTIHVQPVTP